MAEKIAKNVPKCQKMTGARTGVVLSLSLNAKNSHTTKNIKKGQKLLRSEEKCNEKPIKSSILASNPEIQK